MKLKINSRELLKALQNVGAVINHNHTMPIAQCFLFEVDGGLKITATDLDITMTTEIPAEGSGKIAVPAKYIQDILKAMPDHPIELEAERSILKLIANTGTYKIPCNQASEYPTMVDVDNTDQLIIPAYVLREGINKTLFCTATDAMRPTLESVLLAVSDSEITFAATDTHRISEYKYTGASGQPIRLLIPKKPLTLLKGTTEQGDVKVSYNQINARFEFENTVFVCRLIEGKFVNYEAVLPKNMPYKLIIGKNELLASLKRMAIFSDSQSKKVVFNLSVGKLELTSGDVNQSTDAKEILQCTYEGDVFAIAFNHSMITNIINSLQCDNLSIEVAEQNRGAIITPCDGLEENERVLFLQMPLRLQD